MPAVHPSLSDRRRLQQHGGIIGKFITLVLLLSIALVVGGIIYLGSAEMPPPTSQANIPVSADALQRQ